jgi:SNF2 family DNA or RNA helicase
MSQIISSNEQLIQRINATLAQKSKSKVNIVNDKLTLSVFSELQSNIKNVNEINLILREWPYMSRNKQISQEFEINKTSHDMIFSSYDIIEKNSLKHLNQAKSMYDFIEKHVNVRKTLFPDTVKSNFLLIDQDYGIYGDSSLELHRASRHSSMPTFTLNFELDDPKQITQLQHNFLQIWNNSQLTQDFKKQLLESLQFVYKEYSPEFLYYFTLHELFGHLLDESLDRLETDRIGFQKTEIWKSLYKFQKDAVVSAIRKIEKYNGCIIADSVGLGKTFEALAVIKYYELRQHKVLVLTPAKLYDNWESFRNFYTDNRFNRDRFAYDIAFHTDLSRPKGKTRTGMDIERINWGNYDLLVIDESHNFRNRIEQDDHLSRYSKLINDVIKKGVKTKVLLLSATPVNNSLRDLKNQLSIINIDDNSALSQEGIANIDYVLRKAQTEINEWLKEEDRSKNALLDRLPSAFFKLLEMISISRSRKHITRYYGNEEMGKFPVKLKPLTFKPYVDVQNELLHFHSTNEILEKLKLAVYSPMSYIKPEKRAYYRDKFQTRYGERIIFLHEERELALAVLHRFNLFKRLESSVYSFSETIRRLLEKINRYVELLTLETPANFEASEIMESEEEELLLDYKYEINISHLMKARFLEDLLYDQEILEKVYSEVQTILRQNRDAKVQQLLEMVQEKLENTPYNPGNKKILIFTAFADTANYLYDTLSKQLDTKLYSLAMVTGSSKPKTTLNCVDKEFNTVLKHFSPLSKMNAAMAPEKQIDVLVATDCLSEGQNLQDADCVINYDIQWNPVILIQRFGRIDRIGSRNEKIAMINFFPHMELNEYLRLEQRVKGKMTAVNISSSGDEDVLTPEMNDFVFRARQLEKLQQEVVDLDDMKEGISLTDLNMNDYLYELSVFTKDNPEIKKVPRGIYSVVSHQKKGCIYCFRYSDQAEKPRNESSLFPYYLVFVQDDQQTVYGSTQARELLQEFRSISYQQSRPDKMAFDLFMKKTHQAKDMSCYSKLLNQAIQEIKGEESQQADKSLLDFGGYHNPFAASSSDDFELISFMVLL